MRLLLIEEDGKYTSDSDKIDPDIPKLIDDVDDGGEFYGEVELVEPLNDVHCLVVRHTLNIQLRDDHDLQRTNIFHSRCFIKVKDSGTNLHEEGGMMQVSIPKFRLMDVMGSHFLKA
ncbi:hypothetical protein PVK06_047981 [Gossypium arboreum]|uniref:Uncharacterized protein n=1 Tax=Gossypium arboreum TaxID=29729 RepID=A0ABR0MHB7_GOSAR|nr:hypothetical protein PVK06_047981 [Gossypium arboreum]